MMLYMEWSTDEWIQRGWRAPALDLRLLAADRAHRRAARADDRRGAVLLDLLDPAAVDAVHARRLGGRTLQRRPAELPDRRRLAGGRRRGARALLRAAEPGGRRREERRSCTASTCRGAPSWWGCCRCWPMPGCCWPRRCASSNAVTSSSVAPPATPVAASRWTTTAVVVLLVVAVTLQVTRDRIAPPPPDVAAQLWMQSPDGGAPHDAVVHRPGRRPLLDTRGDPLRGRAAVDVDRASGYTLLYPLLDMATTLDPHFDVAARLGAIFLSEGYPGGAGRTDQALQLLEKGLAARTRPLAVPPRHRLRPLLVAEGLPGGGAPVRARQPDAAARPSGCRRWPP